MRVAMLTTRWAEDLDAPTGGVEAVLASLVPALLRVQPDLDLHVVHCPAKERATRKLGAPAFTLHQLPGRVSGIRRFRLLNPHRRIERFIADLRPDVVHVQAVAFLFDGRRCPAVLTVHGMRERDALFETCVAPWLRSWTLGRLERDARTTYRHIIALTGYAAQYLRAHTGGRLHFVPNPVDEGFFTVRREEAGPCIVFVGRVRILKNIHGLIEAVGLLARDGVECTLRLAGPLESAAYGERLRGLVQRWRLEGRVEFLGNLDRPALREAMRTARCLVLPSFQENAPMVVSEAGAMGIPAVAAAVGGAPEMVAHGYSGFLVDPRSPASIAAGLKPLLLDASLAATFGERARDLAQVYHPDAVARQTLAVYEAVAEEFRSR